MQVNIHEAKTNLSRLIEKVAKGQEVVIAKAGKPVAQLVPFRPRGGKKTLGTARGIGELKEGWDAPLTDQEMADWFGL